MFEFGPINRRRTDDVRPAVCEVLGSADAERPGRMDLASGRQPRNASGVRLHRQQSEGVRIAAARPRLQRATRTTISIGKLRPSLWIEPIADWGEGSVQLVEIPTEFGDQRQHRLLLAAEAQLRAGAEARLRLSAVLVLAATDAADPRRRDGCRGRPRRSNQASARFVVEFSGDHIRRRRQRTAESKPALSTSVGTIASVQYFSSQGAQDLSCPV